MGGLERKGDQGVVVGLRREGRRGTDLLVRGRIRAKRD